MVQQLAQEMVERKPTSLPQKTCCGENRYMFMSYTNQTGF